MKWRCTVCGYIHDGDTPPDKCPKCGAPQDKFERLDDEAAGKIERSRFTNDLLVRLIVLTREMADIAEKGIEDELDPPCVGVFRQAARAAVEVGQAARAEIAVHVGRGKWG